MHCGFQSKCLNKHGNLEIIRRVRVLAQKNSPRPSKKCHLFACTGLLTLPSERPHQNDTRCTRFYNVCTGVLMQTAKNPEMRFPRGAMRPRERNNSCSTAVPRQHPQGSRTRGSELVTPRSHPSIATVHETDTNLCIPEGLERTLKPHQVREKITRKQQ